MEGILRKETTPMRFFLAVLLIWSQFPVASFADDSKEDAKAPVADSKPAMDALYSQLFPQERALLTTITASDDDQTAKDVRKEVETYIEEARKNFSQAKPAPAPSPNLRLLLAKRTDYVLANLGEQKTEGGPTARMTNLEQALLKKYLKELGPESQKEYDDELKKAETAYGKGDTDAGKAAAGDFAEKWRGVLKTHFSDFSRKVQRGEKFPNHLELVKAYATKLNAARDLSAAQTMAKSKELFDNAVEQPDHDPVNVPSSDSKGSDDDKPLKPQSHGPEHNQTPTPPPTNLKVDPNDKEAAKPKEEENKDMKNVWGNVGVGALAGLILGLALMPVMGPIGLAVMPLAGAALLGGIKYASNKWGG